MRVARYVGNGEVAIVEEEVPKCPDGGLLVQAEACGLCSGELMSWYMDGKIPHVLGHEVSGMIVESNHRDFPVGKRVFPHHHASCRKCEMCLSGREVHCEQWKRTRLIPGGMADFFGVPAGNLTDTHRVDDLRAVDAALAEPLACVCKAIRLSGLQREGESPTVIGLGNMGLLHMLALPENCVGYDLNESRLEFARNKGLNVRSVADRTRAKTIFVCPGSQSAFDLAMSMIEPGGTIVLFAPLPPGVHLQIPQSAYFSDIKLVNSYSAGPSDTLAALEILRKGVIRAELICSHFISLPELPRHYVAMKSGEILKPMVVWDV